VWRLEGDEQFEIANPVSDLVAGRRTKGLSVADVSRHCVLPWRSSRQVTAKQQATTLRDKGIVPQARQRNNCGAISAIRVNGVPSCFSVRLAEPVPVMRLSADLLDTSRGQPVKFLCNRAQMYAVDVSGGGSDAEKRKKP
jgi:hypothetical protein